MSRLLRAFQVRRIRRLELLRLLVFPSRIIAAPKRPIRLPEQTMGHVVVGVHLDRSIKIYPRHQSILLLEESLAEQDIRPARRRFQQQCLVQRNRRLREIASAKISVAQTLIAPAPRRDSSQSLCQTRQWLRHSGAAASATSPINRCASGRLGFSAIAFRAESPAIGR